MSENYEPENNGEKPNELPDFPYQYVWAFITLMLYKLGGVETISVKLLEEFDMSNAPEIFYSEEQKAWQMKLRDKDMPKKIVMPKVPKSILRRLRKGSAS